MADEFTAASAVNMNPFMNHMIRSSTPTERYPVYLKSYGRGCDTGMPTFQPQRDESSCRPSPRPTQPTSTDCLNTSNNTSFTDAESIQGSPNNKAEEESSSLTTSSFHEHLIQLVQSYPCIWQTTCPLFKNKDQKQLCWADIGVALGKDG